MLPFVYEALLLEEVLCGLVSNRKDKEPQGIPRCAERRDGELYPWS